MANNSQKLGFAFAFFAYLVTRNNKSQASDYLNTPQSTTDYELNDYNYTGYYDSSSPYYFKPDYNYYFGFNDYLCYNVSENGTERELCYANNATISPGVSWREELTRWSYYEFWMYHWMVTFDYEARLQYWNKNNDYQANSDHVCYWTNDQVSQNDFLKTFPG